MRCSKEITRTLEDVELIAFGVDLDELNRAEPRAGELDEERRAVEPAQASPFLARGVVEPVLDDGLLDREVEERLAEASRRDHEREEPEDLLRVERPCGDDRREEPEHDGRVDADGRDRTANEKPAHQPPPV